MTIEIGSMDCLNDFLMIIFNSGKLKGRLKILSHSLRCLALGGWSEMSDSLKVSAKRQLSLLLRLRACDSS